MSASNADFARSRQDLIFLYNRVIGGIDAKAIGDDKRAYGGVIRSGKGKLVENMARSMFRLAWVDAGGQLSRLSFGNVKRYQVHVQDEYIGALPDVIREYIDMYKNQHHYWAKVDVHVFVDDNLVLGMECKSYTENAMLKRILVDFRMLKSLHPDLICCLLQMESMLGGGYSDPLASP